MRCAQAGGPPPADAPASDEPAAAPVAPSAEEPAASPVTERAPAAKLERMLSAARVTARRSGEMAALAPARATPPSPEATPAAPDWPAAPRL